MTIKDLGKRIVELESAAAGRCPSCGACQHCGHRPQPFYVYPYVPYVQPYTYPARWYVTWGSDSATGGSVTYQNVNSAQSLSI